MRILQAGNANFGYVMARELRRRGIEADLLVSRQAVSGPSFSINDPRSHDPDLDSYPEWVIFYDRCKRGKTLDIIRMMRGYDLVSAYNTLPSHAMLSGRPYVAVTGGDELRKKAFERSLTGYLLRKAYKKADRTVYTWPIAKPYLERLGIDNAEFIPRVWDARGFARKAKTAGGGTLRIFMPTAQMWDLKGNDKFLGAFARLCAEKADVFLYCMDWGPDSEKARKILARPECAGRAEVIPGPVSRESMAGYMEKSDILVDQFNTGSFTRVGIEAFHFGIPVMVNLDEKLFVETHGDTPSVLQCATEGEIYEKIRQSMEDRGRLAGMGAASKEWVLRHFDMQRNIDRHLALYQEILKK